jgi:hypothetical protein
MADRPILFSAPMVRALLAGTKTQTRRVVKDQTIGERYSHTCDDGRVHLEWLGTPCCGSGVWDVPEHSGQVASPYGLIGDRLWVRESHWLFQDEHDPVTGYTPPVLTTEDVEYRADGESTRHRWRPSIHMPRWASRITLNITGVRVERLQAISESDAMDEGAEPILVPPDGGSCPHVEGFEALWKSINGAESWDGNPWVWVVEFKVAKS